MTKFGPMTANWLPNVVLIAAIVVLVLIVAKAVAKLFV